MALASFGGAPASALAIVVARAVSILFFIGCPPRRRPFRPPGQFSIVNFT
jgi:hypothetical protein